MLSGLLFSALALGLFSNCTQRRRADAPVPDGDTIEVVIPDKSRHQEAARIIEVQNEEETIANDGL